MAARERETAVVVGAAGAKPSELRGGSSAFRRTADFYEERQIPGPRRFGFGGSPPRRNHYDQQSQQRPSPPRSTNHHQDTPRQTILPSSRGSPSSPSIGSRASLLSPPRPIIGTASNDVRALLNDTNGGGQTDDGVEEGLTSPTAHPVFSQLAAVLGFELAKKVTARHPRETDLNRLANLALDITTAPGLPLTALESGAAVTSAPSRSASTTSATSTHSEQRSAARRGLGGGGGGHFNRPSGNRSPLDEQRGRYGGGGGRSVRSSLGSAAGRTRASSTPLATAAATAAGATDDSFVTAVSAASAAASAASIPRSPAPSSSPRPHTVVSDETTTDVRTDNTAMDDNEEDLIDWDGETAAPPEEEEHNEAVPSAHSTIECAPHLLD